MTLTVVDARGTVTERRRELKNDDGAEPELQDDPADVGAPDDADGVDGDGTVIETDRDEYADGTPEPGVLATLASIAEWGTFSGVA